MDEENKASILRGGREPMTVNFQRQDVGAKIGADAEKQLSSIYEKINGLSGEISSEVACQLVAAATTRAAGRLMERLSDTGGYPTMQDSTGEAGIIRTDLDDLAVLAHVDAALNDNRLRPESIEPELWRPVLRSYLIPMSANVTNVDDFTQKVISRIESLLEKKSSFLPIGEIDSPIISKTHLG